MRSKNFDRHNTIQPRVQGTVNFSHATRGERRLDFVGTEFRARGKSHPCRAIIVPAKGIEAERLWTVCQPTESDSVVEVAFALATGVLSENAWFRKLSRPLSPLGLSLWITSGLRVISSFPT